MARLPKLPSLLDRKIYKTGQTRGADDDQIFQNRVGRNSTVLIPFPVWVQIPALHTIKYENGFIVLINPRDFFEVAKGDISAHGLEIGRNALVYYERRDEWLEFHPDKYGFKPPTSRIAPLGGQYVARIANTTAETDERINIGYTSTGLKGAGIRLYEYADTGALGTTRIQLEAVFWHAVDAVEKMLAAGMTEDEIRVRRAAVLDHAARASTLRSSLSSPLAARGMMPLPTIMFTSTATALAACGLLRTRSRIRSRSSAPATPISVSAEDPGVRHPSVRRPFDAPS